MREIRRSKQKMVVPLRLKTAGINSVPVGSPLRCSASQHKTVPVEDARLCPRSRSATPRWDIEDSPCSATTTTTAAGHQQAAGAETAGAEPMARSGSWGGDKKRERAVVFTTERAPPLGLR